MTEFALGVAPELDGLVSEKGQAAKAALVLQALGKLAALLGVGPPEGDPAGSEAARRWRLRERLMELPPEVRDHLHGIVQDVFRDEPS